MEQNCYITFFSIHQAIRAEKLLETERYKYKMVPVPRSISSSCGTALQYKCQDITTLRDFLRERNIEIDGLYRVKEEKLRTLSVEILS
ncbi:MAG: DUF3343 domain-containing protein [Bacillota bacterium]|nr:DUF3343 domain-containing protein [Bacillota bacterium]